MSFLSALIQHSSFSQRCMVNKICKYRDIKYKMLMKMKGTSKIIPVLDHMDYSVLTQDLGQM